MLRQARHLKLAQQAMRTTAMDAPRDRVTEQSLR